MLRPSSSTAPAVPLVPYRLADGSATALVPAGADWTILGGNGVIQGSSPNKGSFLFGFSISILTPQNAPANPPASMLIYPYMNAATALGVILHRLSPSVSNFSIRRVLQDAALPSYTSSGMLLFDFLNNGRPWVGVATIGTDSPANYGNFSWTMYYSGVSVPADSDGSVGQALLRAWHSWDPSAAIAARTQASLGLIDETNAIWDSVSQFSSATRDREARDVGCLLLGYYDVEDNSRKFNLPSAPCGLAYVPTSG